MHSFTAGIAGVALMYELLSAGEPVLFEIVRAAVAAVAFAEMIQKAIDRIEAGSSE